MSPTGSPARTRVVFVGQSGSAAGGAERSMELLLRHLPERFAPHVILFEEGTYAGDLRERGFPVDVVPVAPEMLSVQREHVPARAVFGSARTAARLAAAFGRLRADVVYTNTVKAHVLGAPAARLAGVPAVMHLRDILKGRARMLLRAVGTTCTKRRIAISHAVAERLALSRTEVVSNPVDLAAYRTPPARAEARRQCRLPQGVPLVGIVGRINRWKGHDRFLRIAAKLRERSDVHFAIVGKAMFRDADFAAQLPALAAAAGLADRVHFVPWLEDPRTAYAALDVNANTSRAEPFGRTIVEAAACGVPTVCFDEGGAPEAVVAEHDSCGLVVPSDDEDAFAGAVVALLNGDRLAQANRCRAHAARFDPALHAARIGRIIDAVSVRRG